MKEKSILRISGGTSHLDLYDNYLTITPSNVQRLSGTSKTIPLASIVTISIEKPFLKTPYLQVVTAGMVPQKGDYAKGSAANVVFIQPGNMAKAKQLQQYVLEFQSKGTATSNSQTSNIDDLEKLAQLRDKGIITQEEFDAKKKQILGL